MRGSPDSGFFLARHIKGGKKSPTPILALTEIPLYSLHDRKTMYFQLGLLALIVVTANGFQEDISSLCIFSPKLELIAGVTEVSAL